MFSVKYKLSVCRSCGRNSQPHKAFGLCRTCYLGERGYDWSKSYQKRNRKRLNEYQKDWAIKHKESTSASKRKYRLTHREVGRVNLVEWRKKHKTTKCVLCDETRVVDWAHILARKDGGRKTRDNLVELCPNHHCCFDRGLLTQEEKQKLDYIISEIKSPNDMF